MSAFKPVDRKESSDRCTPAKADCTSNRDPPSHNKFDADSQSGSSTSRPSGPAFHAHDGPAADGIDLAIVNGWSGHVGRIGHHDVERGTVESPCPRTLPNIDLAPRPQRRYRASSARHAGQMSKAVTLAQPNSAAAIATKPLPVHRSSTCLPATIPVRSIESTRRRESCCGWYTFASARRTTGAGYVVVKRRPSSEFSGIAAAITAWRTNARKPAV